MFRPKIVVLMAFSLFAGQDNDLTPSIRESLEHVPLLQGNREMTSWSSGQSRKHVDGSLSIRSEECQGGRTLAFQHRHAIMNLRAFHH